MFILASFFNKEKITVISPRPFQGVGAKFLIDGLTPKTWLETDFDMSYNDLSLEIIDINGKTIAGMSINVLRPKQKKWYSKFIKRFYFYKTFQFSKFSVGFIHESQGRMTIKISGYQEEKSQSVYIPIIVKQFVPVDGGNPELIKKHGEVGNMIVQYEKDLKVYYKELEKIDKRRELKIGTINNDGEQMNQYISDWDLSGGIFEILEKAENYNNDYPFTQEDLDEEKLKEKYKDAIEWQEPLLGVIAGRLDGFEFRIFSNDYGKHFHVIHRGRGINARFSFPEIKLVNYKQAKNTISSKEVNKISAYFKNPDNFKRLETEFIRREPSLAN